MTGLWRRFAEGDEAPARDDIPADLADGEFTVDAPEALPAHIEAFLALKRGCHIRRVQQAAKPEDRTTKPGRRT